MGFEDEVEQSLGWMTSANSPFLQRAKFREAAPVSRASYKGPA
jgi:hypothetical protein